MGSTYNVQQRTQSPLTFPFNQMHPETGVAVLFAAITGFSGFGQVRGHHGQGTNANSDKLCISVRYRKGSTKDPRGHAPVESTLVFRSIF